LPPSLHPPRVTFWHTTYYWRVRAAKGSVEFSSWSSVWSFTTKFVYRGGWRLENIESGKTGVVIVYWYGYRAENVVENSPADGKFHWKNLELRLNGVIVPAEKIITFASEGRSAFGQGYGYYSMVPGNWIRIQLDTPLKRGDKVSLKWVPLNLILVENTIY